MAKGGTSAALRKAAREARAMPRQVVDASVADMRRTMTKALKADTGGDAALSRAGNKKLTVKVTATGDSPAKGRVTAGPFSRLRAQWFWLEEGTDPHIAGGKFQGALHPGTPPKRTWSKATPEALERVSKVARKRLGKIMRG